MNKLFIPLAGAVVSLFAGTALADNYPINYALDTHITNNGRALNKVLLTSPTFGRQTVDINQGAGGLLYISASPVFVASPGETVTASFDWSGSWMHGYVYLDRGNDGQFTTTLGTNSAIPAGSDVMSFSNCDGYNSAGVATNNGNVGVNPPTFTIPAELAPGLYQMRYKIDWNSINPGGSNGDPQYIDKNGGAIADVRIYVTKPMTPSVTVNATHGSVTLDNGNNITINNITAGSPLTVKFNPDKGYTLAKLQVKSGYSLPENLGVTYATGIQQAQTLDVPGSMIENNSYTIPAANVGGEMVITATFVSAGGATEGNYECELSGAMPTGEGFSKVTIGGQNLDMSPTERFTLVNSVLPIELGKEKSITAKYNGNASKITLSIDVDQNGLFSTELGEQFSVGANGETMSSFTLPSNLRQGVYRARLEAEGHSAVDFRIECWSGEPAVNVKVINGLALKADQTALPNTMTFGSELTAAVQPVYDGYQAGNFKVRYGHNLNGEQQIRGNEQWYEETVSDISNITLSPSKLHGSVVILGEFTHTDQSLWVPIWSDEFDGSTLNTDYWSYHPRYTATWNKRIAQNDEIPYVNKFEDGCYKSYSIATPSQFASSDSQPIITGAIYSHNKVYMTGGRIEARLRTRGHTGNFPAFWLMPKDGSLGWPKCGEIDIWEQINTSFTTYHTIHSGWTYKSFGTVTQSSPKSSGSSSANPDMWHVYALEWDGPSELRWYLDGKLVFTYTNTHYSEGSYTEEITWPFNKDFYIILNQSVGDGSWAAAGDASFEYLTEFDYVRCYQRRDALNYYTKATGAVSAVESIESDTNANEAPVYYNLQGVRIDASKLTPGIYIERRGNKTTKKMIR